MLNLLKKSGNNAMQDDHRDLCDSGFLLLLPQVWVFLGALTLPFIFQFVLYYAPGKISVLKVIIILFWGLVLLGGFSFRSWEGYG